jgi:carboxylesterase
MAGCLLIHGLGGGPSEFGNLPEALGGLGLEPLTITLPGHEGPGPRMPVSGWEDWAVGMAHRGLVARCGGKAARVAVVGFSTGATLALELASRDEEVGPLVLLAPFLAIRRLAWMPARHGARAIGTMARVVPSVPRRPLAIRDRACRREATGLDRFRTFHLGAAANALRLIETVRPRVSRIRSPALIVQGRCDSVVDPTGAAWLFNHLGSAQKQLQWLDHSDHLLLLDAERQQAIALITEFLGQHLEF